MQSIIKDFLNKVTSAPPTTFWKYQGGVNDDDDENHQNTILAELEVAKLGLGQNNNTNNNNSNSKSNTTIAKTLHQYVPLATTLLSKATGHTVFSQLQGALRHGGRPSLTAFQSLRGADVCMDISSPTTGASNSNKKSVDHQQDKNSGTSNKKTNLETLAAGEEEPVETNSNNDDNKQGDDKKAPKKIVTTHCTCQADSPSLCPFCHETLRTTLWKLYALTTALFSFRESCALVVNNSINSKTTSNVDTNTSNNTSSSAQASKDSHSRDQLRQQLFLLLPSVFAVAEASKQARTLATRVFLYARKISHRWQSQQQQQQQSSPSPANNNNNLDETQTPNNGNTDDKKQNQKRNKNNSTNNNTFEANKFFTAVFIEHSVQVALDVLAMLVTGFETDSTHRYGSLSMDKLSSKQYKESCPYERKVVETLLKLREVAVTTLSQSLLLTREGLVSSFVFAKHCHAVIVGYDDPFAQLRKQQMNSNNSRDGQQESDDEDDEDEMMANHFQTEEEIKALQTAQALISERQERTLIQIELSSLKFSSAVLTPPTVLDVKNIDEKGEHPSSFVASELCDANLETANVYTGVQRQQISISIINRVAALLEHEEKQFQELQREKFQSKIADPFGKIRQTGEEARRKEELANQISASQQRQTKLTEHYTIYASRFLLHIASHDLWSSFAKLPSKVRANRIQQHNHQQMMVMMEKEQKKRNNGRSSAGGGTEVESMMTSNFVGSSPQQPRHGTPTPSIVNSPNENTTFNNIDSSAFKSPIRSKSATIKSSMNRNQNEETVHGTVILLPPRKSRVGSFFGNLTIDELERFSTCLANFATAFPVEEESDKATTKIELTSSIYGKKEKKNQQETCALPMYGNISAIDRKTALSCLIGIHWCLYKEEDFVPGSFANIEQAKKLGVLHATMTNSATTPSGGGAQNRSVGFTSPLSANNIPNNTSTTDHGMSVERSRTLFPFLSSPKSPQYQQQPQPDFNSPPNSAFTSPLSVGGGPHGAGVNFSLRRLPTQSDAWQSGLFNLTTVSLSMGLSHFHSIGLNAHCASMARHDPLATGLTMAQHRGVLHVPIGDDIFIDSGFMPVVKGRSSNIALEAPPCHPIDPQDYAPGLNPIDKRSTVSAVLNAALLAPPREEEDGNHHQNGFSAGMNNNNNNNNSINSKSEPPCEVTGMASLCTTTLIAVAAPKRQVARIPFSSVKVGSLHKNTAGALNTNNSNSNSDADEDVNKKNSDENEDNGDEFKFFDEATPVFDPENAKAASHREQHLDLNRSLVVLNCARHLSNIQLGIRSEIVGVNTQDAFGQQIADRSFSATGFIFTTATEGVSKTSMRPEWYRLGIFAAEHAEKQKRPPLHHPVIHGDKTKEELEKQRQRAAEELFGNQLNDQPLTLAEKRKQRWTQEASLHARRAKLAEKKKRKNRHRSSSKSPDGKEEAEETAQDRHARALEQIGESDARQHAAEEIIKSGEAPDFVNPESALQEAHAVAARKCELLEEELEQMRKERDEAQNLVRDLRNQSDVVATCVIPPLQSEVRLMRHLLGQTLGALRAAESVAENQNDKFKDLEKKLRTVMSNNKSNTAAAGVDSNNGDSGTVTPSRNVLPKGGAGSPMSL